MKLFLSLLVVLSVPLRIMAILVNGDFFEDAGMPWSGLLSQRILINARGFPELYVTACSNGVTQFSQEGQGEKFNVLLERRSPSMPPKGFILVNTSVLLEEKDAEILLQWRCTDDGNLRIVEKYRYTSNSLTWLAQTSYRIVATNDQRIIEVIDSSPNVKRKFPTDKGIGKDSLVRPLLTDGEVAKRTYTTHEGQFTFSKRCVIRVPQFPDLHAFIYQHKKYTWGPESVLMDFARKMPDGRFDLLTKANDNYPGETPYLEDIAVLREDEYVEMFVQWHHFGNGGWRTIEKFHYTSASMTLVRQSCWSGKPDWEWYKDDEPKKSFPIFHSPEK